MNTTNKEKGFIKIIVMLIILILVFTMSGFSIRDGLSVKRLQSTQDKITRKITNLYNQHAREPVSQFIINPGMVIGTTINTQIIEAIRKNLHTLTKPSANNDADKMTPSNVRINTSPTNNININGLNY